MTQQPYAPQGYPPQQYQPQPPPQQYQQPYAPPQQPYGYPPQGYGQPAPQGPPAVPLATGSIDDFYNQPQAAGGPGISWKDKPLGMWYAGVIEKDATQAVQDTDYNTKQPLFQKDGVTPKLVLPILLTVDPAQFPEFPEGSAVFYVRGQARDALQLAMSEAGCSGAPRAGAYFQVQLIQRKANSKGNPSNIVQIVYRPKDGIPHTAPETAQQHHAGIVADSQPTPQPAPPAPAPQQYAQPAPPVQQAPPAPQPMAPPVQQPVAPMGAPSPAPIPQQVQQQAPAPLPPAPVAPPGLDPQQQAVLATLTQPGQQPVPQQAQG